MRDRIEIAPGVTRHLAHRQAVYTGTPAAIVAAGLARAQDLPEVGCITINPDGSRALRAHNYGKGLAAGKKMIVVRCNRSGTVAQIHLSLSQPRLDAIEAEKVNAAACLRFHRLGGGFIYLGPRPTEVHA